MKNKIIIIEGTDCSGKKTQAELLFERLNNAGFSTQKFGFPNYNSPTGKIIGGPYLGKEHISKPYFPETAVNVPAKVASLYFAADRYYNKPVLEDMLKHGHLILDRYVDSNMHQAGKISSKKERYKIYKWLSHLEYDMLKLPKPDIKILLFMPREFGAELKKSRQSAEALDQHEMSEEHLKMAETAYLEIAKLKKYKIINCVKDNKVRTIEDINQEIYNFVVNKLK